MAISRILQDGKWHTSTEIAAAVGIGQKYAADLLRTMQQEWGLLSSPRKGWRLETERDQSSKIDLALHDNYQTYCTSAASCLEANYWASLVCSAQKVSAVRLWSATSFRFCIWGTQRS